jgi:hypothetical protein
MRNPEEKFVSDLRSLMNKHEIRLLKPSEQKEYEDYFDFNLPKDRKQFLFINDDLDICLNPELKSFTVSEESANSIRFRSNLAELLKKHNLSIQYINNEYTFLNADHSISIQFSGDLNSELFEFE